ncbi:MAG: DUF2934 domain-containing protein [Acidobacteria bacterium]|nr:DUF2934 domain-containing protein [Acidobacteriota bacterium]
MTRRTDTQCNTPGEAALAAPDGGTGTVPNAVPVPAHEEIARLAYSYWEARGGQGGSPEEDWARAERELCSRPRAMAASGGSSC